jgi:hypothetical protein
VSELVDPLARPSGGIGLLAQREPGRVDVNQSHAVGRNTRSIFSTVVDQPRQSASPGCTWTNTTGETRPASARFVEVHVDR